MLPFGVTIPATVPQGSEIPEWLMNNPVYPCNRRILDKLMFPQLDNRLYSSKLKELQFHYCVHRSLTQYHGLIQCHLFYTLQTNHFQISFNIMFVTMSWFIPLRFQTMNFHARHKSRCWRHSRFTHFNMISRLYMTNFLLFDFIQASLTSF